jgi:uncharacterized protein YjbI with pentapeptide repeats
MAQARVLPAQATATEPVAEVNRGVELSDKPVEEMTSFAGQDLRDEPIPQVTLIGASFEGAILKRCDFSKRDLSHADFRDADLYRAVFKEANLYTTNFRGADLTRADFRGARLYGVNIYDADVTRAVFDETVIEEKDGDFSKAADVYITLNRVLKENGDVERAAAYYRQRVCQRRTRASQLSALLERIFDWLVGYGEKPIRTVYAAILTIVACAPTYLLLGHASPGSVQDLGGAAPENLQTLGKLPTALELSLIAFVGADMNTWRLTGWARTLMAVEALLGVILLAVILIGFSRKVIRD